MTLTVITSPQKVRRFEVYDFEWIPGTLKMRLCGRYSADKGYQHYPTVDDFLNDTLTFSNRGKWFFAHAGGLADVQFVFEKLANRKEYVIEASFSGSSAIIVKVKRDKHVWTFCDSYWIFRDSLKTIGEAIGMPKLGPANEINMTTEDMKKWYAEVELRELIPYNQRDCEILYTALDQFQNLLLEEGGTLQKTIASCGMMLFRRRFLKTEIRTNNGVNEIARQAYHASRVEPIAYNCVNANYFDVNSSFPFSMTNPLPGNLVASYSSLPDRLLKRQDRSYLVKASITVPDTYLPPIPYRRGGRLFFPVGSWTGWFIDVDFELLIREGGKVNKIYESYEFDTFTDMADYSMTIYDKRKNSKTKFEKTLYKYLLNCLYGKMAERPEKKRLWINPSTEILRGLKPENMISAQAGGIFLEDVKLPLEHVHVPVSVRITAYSRRLLYDFMTDAYNGCYYCDTDGFATDDEFLTSSELGGLKLEKKIIHGEFYAPKVYSLTIEGKDGQEETIVHAKGFSLGKDDAEAKRRFQAIIEGQQIGVERMSRLRENLRTNIAPVEKVIKKSLSKDIIPKRFFYPDGASRPWHVDEIKSFTKEK